MHATYIPRPNRLASYGFLAVFFLFSQGHAATATGKEKILVSIKPLHSLISHLTEGIDQTDLLLDQQQSPHHFQLRPSQKRLLNQATIFFYSSDNLESFVRSIKNSSDKLLFIELAKTPGLQLLPLRGLHDHDDNQQNNHPNNHQDKLGARHQQPAADNTETHNTEPHNTEPPEDKNIDGHIWLSIDNAQLISSYVSDILSRRNPANAAAYQLNLQKLLQQLRTLKQNNQMLLEPFTNRPFLLYHDAYQYFEQENKLSGAFFVTTSPEHSPGIKRVIELKELIRRQQIHCVFYEPPNIPSLIKTLSEDTTVKLSVLDPVGSQLAAGKQHYFELMHNTAQTLYDCLNTP